MSRYPYWLVCVGLLLAVETQAGAPPTVGDLLKKPVDVRPGEAVSVDPALARANWEAFLALDGGDPALRADALRRLADLKLEAGEDARAQAGDSTVVPAQIPEAIAMYRRLLATVPGYPQTDQVLYQLSRASEAAGQFAESTGYLSELLRRFPASPLAAEAAFRQGELDFSAHQWRAAEADYRSLIEHFPRSEFIEQATYKLGWACYKGGANDEALDAFVMLLDRMLVTPNGTARDLETFTRPQRELVDDTLRVMAVVFSMDEAAQGADRLLQRVGRRAYEDQLYATLGDLYAGKERWTDAAAAYNAYARRDPSAEKSAVLASVAIDALRHGGFTEQVVLAKQDYVDRYALGSPFWSQRAASDVPLVIRELKQNLKDLAGYYHQQAQSTHKAEAYQAAARYYRDYLRQFPGDTDSAETNYLLADALFESQQYAPAAAEYHRTAYDYPLFARSATAAYAAVVAAEKDEASAEADKAARHERALDEAAHFADAFPAHPESGKVLVRTARLRLEDGQRAEAIELARKATERKDLSQELQRDAWNVISTAEFALGHFKEAESAGVAALADAAQDAAARQAIGERIAASIYRQAEALRDAGKPGDAAALFERVGREVPTASIRETADFDAAAAYLAAQQWTDAITALEHFRERYPRSPQQAEVTRRLAAAQLSANHTGVAADEFRRVAEDGGTDPQTRRQALLEAAELYEKAGNRTGAKASLELYVSRYPQPFGAAFEARASLADFARDAHDAPARRKLLEELVHADATAGADRSARSRDLAAHAVLELAQPDRVAFEAVRLTQPLKRSLEAKRAAMQKAIKSYEQAADYAVAEVTTAATFEMAELYRQLGADLLKSERPKGLSGDALEQYGVLLEDQAFPFEEKAISLHELNAARVTEGVYDNPVRNSLTVLAQLKPARYGKSEEHEGLAIDLAGGVSGTAVETADAVRFQEAVALAAADPAAARRQLTALIDGRPGFAGALLDAAILGAQAADYTSALQQLQAAEQLAPASSAVADERGLVLRHLGQFDAAEQAYRAAIERDPGSVQAHRNLGVLLDLYRGKPAAASAEWAKAIELEGGDKLLEGWITEASRRAGPAVRPAAESTP